MLTEDSATSPLATVTAAIDTTIRLGAWLKSHPADRIGVVPPVKQIEDKFCRASHLKLKLGDRTIVRSALFDIPEVPAGEPFPSDTARLAEDLCELRTVWLSTEVPDYWVPLLPVKTDDGLRLRRGAVLKIDGQLQPLAA